MNARATSSLVAVGLVMLLLTGCGGSVGNSASSAKTKAAVSTAAQSPTYCGDSVHAIRADVHFRSTLKGNGYASVPPGSTQDLPCPGRVKVAGDGSADATISAVAICNVVRLPAPGKTAYVSTHDTQTTLMRMKSVQATCTMKATGKAMNVCNEGWLDPSGVVQVAVNCDQDPVFSVAVYNGDPTVIAPDGSSNPLHAGQSLSFNYATKSVEVAEADFTSQQKSMFGEQARQLDLSIPSAVPSSANGAPPISLTPPTVTGARPGDFTANPGQWDGSPPPTFTYQWQTCSDGTAASCVDLPGETSQTIPSAKVPCLFRVSVTATNSLGSARAESDLPTCIG